MHMMSKKELTSGDLDTLRRSRNSTVVLTASGEAHTNEESQVFDHDLNRFVTEQLLEETLAALSLGKICEDHGYSCEWVSGQKTRLTKEGKTIICKTDNIVPLVVPGLPISSWSNSSSTSTSQDLSSTSPAQERSDELAPREWCGSPSTAQKKKKEGWKDKFGQPFARSFLWLVEFTDNLEDAELPAFAHSSQDSGSERPTKVVSKSRKHSFFSLPKWPKMRKVW